MLKKKNCCQSVYVYYITFEISRFVPLIGSMKKSNLRSASRKLRNGKVLNSKKTDLVKKKSSPKTKNDNQLSLLKSASSNLNGLFAKNKNSSHEMTVQTNYGHLFGNHELVILFKTFPAPIINQVSFNDQSNNHNSNNISNKNNCYTNLEDYIQLNEVQIYNKLEPKYVGTDLITRKTKRSIIPSRNLKKQNDLKTKTCDSSKSNEKSSDTRITRRKTVMLQTEERKQLDQIIFNKFPKNTFRMFAIQLNDFTKEVEFLRKLGLTCRFKCPLSTCKVKKKT